MEKIQHTGGDGCPNYCDCEKRLPANETIFDPENGDLPCADYPDKNAEGCFGGHGDGSWRCEHWTGYILPNGRRVTSDEFMKLDGPDPDPLGTRFICGWTKPPERPEWDTRERMIG